MKLPVRHILAFTVAAIAISLTISNHYAKIVQQSTEPDFGFGVPAPPNGTFPEIALVFPGSLAALPLIIPGIASQSNWEQAVGMILGAVFFWYCVGWMIDCAIGSVPQDTPPKFVTIHLRLLSIASVVLFPFALIVGMKVGTYFCTNGKQPFWSEMLMYGIEMTWITVGASFALLRFLQSRPEKISILGLAA